jgi:crossover junction endodeoxyribonuclease RuvC
MFPAAMLPAYGTLTGAGTPRAQAGRRPVAGAESLIVIVLGIDPGLANTGYGVVAHRDGRLVALDGGVIQTAAEAPQERRLADIHAAVEALIGEHEPDAIALEQLYFGQNVRTAFAVGQARGVVMLAAGQRGLRCASYTPQQVKGAVCGSGRAQKDQVARMVKTLLGLLEEPRPDHASDALAVAICHANSAPLAGALAQVGA